MIVDLIGNHEGIPGEVNFATEAAVVDSLRDRTVFRVPSSLDHDRSPSNVNLNRMLRPDASESRLVLRTRWCTGSQVALPSLCVLR